MCRSVKMLSQNQRFSLGKARVRVHSFPNPSLYPQPNQPTLKPPTPHQTTLQQHHTNTASANLAIITTPHHTTHQRP